MAPSKKLTIPVVPAPPAGFHPIPEPGSETPDAPVHLELNLGPTKGDRGELLPGTYKTPSGTIRSDL